MSASAEGPTRSPIRRPAWRLPLAAQLGIVLLLVAAGMGVVSVAYLGPRTNQAFLVRTSRLIDHGSDAMRHMAVEHATGTRDVLTELIRHDADSHRRSLSDLPLTLYAGDVERIREAVLARDDARSRQRESNITVLIAEMDRRSGKRIDGYLAALRSGQETLSASFADELRSSFLGLTGTAIAVLVVLLGLGLHFVVMRPIRHLRDATEAVARGELDFPLQPRRPRHPWLHNHDEIDALSEGFTSMVGELRASRAQIESQTLELERWNRQLEQEVELQSRQLVHAAKMASIGTLAGGVAHEFNNLIGGIRGCAQEALFQGGDAVSREPLEIILRATQRATQITQQLLRFAERRVTRKTRVELAVVVEEVLDLVAAQARRQGVEVTREIVRGLDVLGDSDALHQVFLNLVTNALQAMPQGGVLRVRAFSAGARCSVSVADDGAGIAVGDLDHVFEPFFTTKGDAPERELRGTGLGLSVSYGIVEAHGGVLTVHSVQDQGATFTATIPAIGAPETVTGRAPSMGERRST